MKINKRNSQNRFQQDNTEKIEELIKKIRDFLIKKRGLKESSYRSKM